ncbi:hypothetical protein [Aquimarina sp. 2201CG5-10]|uniref:hypothetical protein n=1 Tax=Aquimarina callyspongiae TaxID=3098150 RepID=UPI002AB48442|nr:hypothetical protein [Aquimarina sp. 2201CG5-10]MDY8134136.1 hypothetical protein [Aquimarina sp. 2201CG5-10]
MLKSILKFEGAHILSKNEQQSIQGSGFRPINDNGYRFCCEWCPDGTCLDYVSSPFETCPFAATCPS